MLIELKIAIAASIIAYVYTEVLMAEGNVLWWWWKIVHQYVKKSYILKPLTDCCLCVSGQMALWSYLFLCEFHLMNLVFTICLSILLTKIIHRWS